MPASDAVCAAVGTDSDRWPPFWKVRLGCCPPQQARISATPGCTQRPSPCGRTLGAFRTRAAESGGRCAAADRNRRADPPSAGTTPAPSASRSRRASPSGASASPARQASCSTIQTPSTCWTGSGCRCSGRSRPPRTCRRATARPGPPSVLRPNSAPERGARHALPVPARACLGGDGPTGSRQPENCSCLKTCAELSTLLGCVSPPLRLAWWAPDRRVDAHERSGEPPSRRWRVCFAPEATEKRSKPR